MTGRSSLVTRAFLREPTDQSLPAPRKLNRETYSRAPKVRIVFGAYNVTPYNVLFLLSVSFFLFFFFFFFHSGSVNTQSEALQNAISGRDAGTISRRGWKGVTQGGRKARPASVNARFQA